MSSNVKLQDIRGFTIQIRDNEDQIWGTGFVVDLHGKIVTCAHVIQATLGKHPRDCVEGETVIIYYPGLYDEAKKRRPAKILAYFPQHDDDVVLLQLTDGERPPDTSPAIIGRAEGSEGNEFRTYGYAALGSKESRYAGGKIFGAVDDTNDRTRQAKLYQLHTTGVRGGMSGAAVLDETRNLVVGVTTSRWNTQGRVEDNNLAWATNTRVLSLEPLKLHIQQEDEPLTEGQRNTLENPAEIRQLANPSNRIYWGNAPQLFDEWVGREALLESITADYANPNILVTGLIGYGGEGKSSLARRWVDQILNSGQKVDGVFWWAFYDRPNTDEFMEAALSFMNPAIDTRKVPGANRKAHMIAAMLASGRYIFVLDGFEVMQGQEGDGYGEIISNDMREFLALFATPGDPQHNSFCLITSRAPLSDLVNYTTYQHRDVTALSPAEGRDLLRNVGVIGQDYELEKVVKQWDGHALTLSLIGGYLKDAHGGDIARIDEIESPVENENFYERVHRVLRRYDEHLSEAERAFMTLFSVFRTPVNEAALSTMFRTASEHLILNTPLVTMTDAEFNDLISHLMNYRMLRKADEQTFTTHPLIRAHYFGILSQREDANETHEGAKNYYLSLAREDSPEFPTMDDLLPLIEVVYHACHAGAYDEAFRIWEDRIDQGSKYVLGFILGANETQLAIMREFFLDGDLSQVPAVSSPHSQHFILNEIGLCLMSLGRLRDAVPFSERAINSYLETEDWRNASMGYQNLTALQAYLGNLAAAWEEGAEALRLAEKAEYDEFKLYSNAYIAWVAHLRGESQVAGEAFGQAEVLEEEIDPGKIYLCSLRGIQHADHLRRMGNADYARRVTEANLGICTRHQWRYLVSQCRRVLGDLEGDTGDQTAARQHYDEALRIARSIQDSAVLIEDLLGRGLWAAKLVKDLPTAKNDLNEALSMCTTSGYRIFEADCRVGLAWLYYHSGNSDLARQEAERAKAMSAEMGYHWGRVDADEILALLPPTTT
jgi:tetratricopeptide (TPR) repeat protein